MTTSGAARLARALASAGARHLFTLSGNQVMPLYDHLVDAGIELLHTRHEAAAVHMADAYARLAERPCPVLLTAGPGHANALGALYVARMAESPVVLLSGHSELRNAGLGAFQEMDQAGLARRVAKAAWVVQDARALGDDLARAYRLAASGRPGPVSLSLPADVLRASADGAAVPAPSAFRPRRRAPSSAETATLGSLIAGAKRPLLLAGPAMARGGAWRSLQRLAERLGVPALPMESPRGPNDPALGGVRTIFPRADLAVLLGRRTDYSLGFGRPPLFAAGVRFHDAGTEPRSVVEAMLAAARPSGDPGWRAEVEAAIGRGREGWAELERSDARPIHPLRLVASARRRLGPDDVFVSDGGEFGQWAQAGIASPARVINGPSGAIGGALPFAIGASLARPGVRVIAFSGDGAAGYHIAELETAVRAKIPFVLVVGNDGLWNAEVVIQKGLSDRELECLRLGPVRYDRVAEALGAHGELVEDPGDLDAALERAAGSGLPALVNVLTAPVPAPSLHA
ncbi:MAG TPA: thiamine pyrophosphate-binding protein [Chloroflexota bacterium]